MLSSFTGLQAVFALCVLIGGALFIVRLILAFLGMGDHDVDHHSLDHDHADSDSAFKLLSFQGLMAFLLMFGLFGLSASKSSHWSNWVSVLVALAAGVITVWLINKLFQLFGKLQHQGNINLANAIGQKGTVYLTITPEEMGKVSVLVQDRLMNLNALPMDPCTLPTGTTVEVSAILHGNILLVSPVAPTK